MITLLLALALWQTPTESVSVAEQHLSVRERTGRNDHPLIDKWLAGCGLDNAAQRKKAGSGFPWCAAFVHGTYQEASDLRSAKNPIPPYAGVLNLWTYAKANEGRFSIIYPEDLIGGLVPKRGDLMIMLFDRGKGHTGLTIDRKSNFILHTIEGNTNRAGSREGDGVYKKERSVTTIVGLVQVKTKSITCDECH